MNSSAFLTNTLLVNKMLSHEQSVANTTPEFSTESLRMAVATKKLLSGSLRINPKRMRDAYIRHPLGDADVLISGVKNRNRALPNDIVAVEVDPKRCWKIYENFLNLDEKATYGETNNHKSKDYVTLKDFLVQGKQDLIKLLGATQVEQLISTLDTSVDPLEVASSEDNDPNQQYLSWRSVIQRTGYVVGIIHKLHNRVCIGYLKLPKFSKTPDKCSKNLSPLKNPYSDTQNNSSWDFANLITCDTRIPWLTIPRSNCPRDFICNPNAFVNTRFVARIVRWDKSWMHPRGQLIRSLSTDASKLIDSETDQILVGAGFLDGVDAVNVFPEEVEESTQRAIMRAMSSQQEHTRFRADFRNYRIFTIDPSTARDLDDALHIRLLSEAERSEFHKNGYKDAMYEVGVHIADVSYFVRPNTPVDEEASRRANTIYLVQLSVPMLPRLLCEQVCSLNPGEDKFAFSVLFILNESGQILKTWIGRSTIRSCARLSYEQAQTLIDTPENEAITDGDFTVESPHNLSAIHADVLRLHHLATHRRKARFNAGALRLDNLKSCFLFDDDKQIPIGIAPYQCKQSNWLVEEWMLAVNEAIAKHLISHLPDSAFLRRHPAPSSHQLTKVADHLQSVGIAVDTQSAGSIQLSLCQEAGCPVENGYQYSPELTSLCAEMSKESCFFEEDLLEKLETMSLRSHNFESGTNAQQGCKMKLEREARLLVAVSVLTKAMNLAEYFCLGQLPAGSATNHYALNMESYTHFTSPIRRYADIIVHRQIAATLALSAADDKNFELASWYAQTAQPIDTNTQNLQRQAEVCNAKNISSRLASEQSAKLFFVLFVKEFGPLTEVCAVTSLLRRSFDVLLLTSGLVHRVYLQNLNLKSSEFVPASHLGSQVKQAAKLCLSLNRDPGDPDGNQCGCFYTEINVFDVVTCQVSLEESDQDGGDSTVVPQRLPKLKLTLLRQTCPLCQTSAP